MRFLWAFLGSTSLLFGVLIAAITVVNPLQEFSGTRFPARLLNTRQMKGDRFDSVSAHNGLAGVIIGSSRSMNLPPSVFSQVTGERFFNFGVFNAAIDDDLAVARYIVATRPDVRDFVVGIDPQSFDPTMNPPIELAHNVRLSTALNGHLGSLWHDVIIKVEAYRDALTVSYLADVAKSARNYSHPPEPVYSFDSVGVLQYPKADGERKAGTYSFKEHFDNCAALQSTVYRNYDSLGVAKRAMLDSLISEATARGIHVVLWTPPFNPALTAILQKDSPAYANYQRSLSYIKSLARPPMVTTVDNSLTSSLPNPDGWYDCMHFDSSNAPTVAHALAEAVRYSHVSAAATSTPAATP
ncbi:MAG: hypothetical protein ABI035_06880 [Gemmatimonadaceae bacterium]